MNHFVRQPNIRVIIVIHKKPNHFVPTKNKNKIKIKKINEKFLL